MVVKRNNKSAIVKTTQNNLVGITWMVAFTFFAATNNVIIKYASSNLHPFVIAFFSSAFSLLICIPFYLNYGRSVFVPKRPLLLLVRGIINSIATVAFFFALSSIPVATATSLSFLAPIIAVFLAALILHEKVGWRRWSAIVVGFLGVLVILRPGNSVIGFGHLSALIAALAFGILFVILRQLGKTETVATVTIYLGIVMTPLTFIPALYFWRWPTSEEFLVLITIGLVGSMIHFCLAAALKWSEAPIVSPIDYLRLIWVVPIAYLIFGEIPDTYTWAGSLIVFGSATYIAIREHDINKWSSM